MTISANQPYFLAYFPYWQLIHAADVFLISDDYAYIKKGWVNRNRIEVNGQIQYFRIEIAKASVHRLISDTLTMPVDVRKKLQTLYLAYHKAPHFEEGYRLMERILSYDDRRLSHFLTHSIREVCDYLGITTTLAHTSQLEGNSLLRREERIYDFCHRLGADHYINAIGGQKLYKREEFAKRGITLSFIHSEAGGYPRGGRPPMTDLSVVDAIMHLSREELHRRLDLYTLIGPEGPVHPTPKTLH